MRIAIPYTGFWPYVRRGAERCIHDLASYLAGRGHEVHIITSTPGLRRHANLDGVRVTYLPQLNHPLLYRYAVNLRMLHFTWLATRELLRDRPDVVDLWTYSAMVWPPFVTSRLGLPYVYHVSVYWELGRGPELFPELPKAQRVVALNRHQAELVEREFGVPCSVQPPPVDLATFRPCAPRDVDQPIVLFTADIADPRKGGALLLRAWSEVRRRCPTARLVLAGSLGVAGWLQDHSGDAPLSRLDLVRDSDARSAIDVLGPGALGSLPFLYSRASVSVLPSIHEAFGLVLTESLACGTPVVSSSHYGPGEIVTESSIGRTVDLRTGADLVSVRRARELAEAIVEAIELSRHASTAKRCREWAAQWAIERVGPSAERILLEAAAGSALPEQRVGARPSTAAPARKA